MTLTTLNDVTWRLFNDPNILARNWMDTKLPEDFSSSEDWHLSPEMRISDAEEVILCLLRVLYLSSSRWCEWYRNNWAGSGVGKFDMKVRFRISFCVTWNSVSELLFVAAKFRRNLIENSKIKAAKFRRYAAKYTIFPNKVDIFYCDSANAFWS